MGSQRTFSTAFVPSCRSFCQYPLLALRSRRLELITLLPADDFRETCRFPAERESKARHGCVAHEVHCRIVFVTRLVIMLLRVLFVLRQAPGLVVAFELHSFID